MSKAKLTNVLMDTIALAGKVSGATGGIIAGIDNAIRADLANDKDLLRAEASLKSALDLCDPKAKAHAAVQTALAHLRMAMEKDFADTTKEQLKGAVLPFQEKVDTHIESMKALIGGLQ